MLLSSGDVADALSIYGVAGVSMAVLAPTGDGDAIVRTQAGGLADKAANVPVYDSTWFEIASLSKPIAAAFALQYFRERGIPMETRVNSLLESADSSFRLRAAAGCPDEWAEGVTITHLLDHTGPQMHYVNGIPRSDKFPAALELISGTSDRPAPYGYASLDVKKPPGVEFGYSGGGFLILQHILELREGRPIADIMREYLEAGGGAGVSLALAFDREPTGKQVADGYRDDGGRVDGGRLHFPPLAAGALGSPAGLLDWLRQLAVAYKRPEGCGCVTHAAARTVLTSRPDLGSEAFMRARMGVGMFVFDVASSDAGRPNRWMLHQAANDGFRGVLLVCFDGPDADRGPRGLVVLCNGDNKGMLCIAAITRALLSSKDAFSPPLEGVDLSRVPSMAGGFDTAGIKQEEIVNLGLKGLVLGAFIRADEASSTEGAVLEDEEATTRVSKLQANPDPNPSPIPGLEHQASSAL